MKAGGGCRGMEAATKGGRLRGRLMAIEKSLVSNPLDVDSEEAVRG